MAGLLGTDTGGNWNRAHGATRRDAVVRRVHGEWNSSWATGGWGLRLPGQREEGPGAGTPGSEGSEGGGAGGLDSGSEGGGAGDLDSGSERGGAGGLDSGSERGRAWGPGFLGQWKEGQGA